MCVPMGPNKYIQTRARVNMTRYCDRRWQHIHNLHVCKRYNFLASKKLDAVFRGAICAALLYVETTKR